MRSALLSADHQCYQSDKFHNIDQLEVPDWFHKFLFLFLAGLNLLRQWRDQACMLDSFAVSFAFVERIIGS